MSADGQGTKWRRKTAENFNRLSTVDEYYRQTTDRRVCDSKYPNVTLPCSGKSNRGSRLGELPKIWGSPLIFQQWLKLATSKFKIGMQQGFFCV